VTAHNSFAQLLPTFALAMIAVGLSAPAAMSSTAFVVSASVMLSTFFGMATLVYGLIALFTAFNSMLHYGTAKEAAPTLMIVIPILTTLGIMMLRQAHGLHGTFEVHTNAGETMVFLSRILSLQFLFLFLGMLVLIRQGYFKDFVLGDKLSPGSYALVCPGVAISVMLHFFINKGLVSAGIIEKFGTIYWIESAVAIGFQFAMVWLVFRLNGQHFTKVTDAKVNAVPAE
jgi:small-conductance mechanosensitive channel